MQLTTLEARKIAMIMCDASGILEGYYRSVISGYTKISYRVGSGQKTYCRGAKDNFVLTYGLKMVQSKASSPQKCAGWLTGREILNMGYCGGELTLLNGLAHTVYHESAHILHSIYRGHGRCGGRHRLPGLGLGQPRRSEQRQRYGDSEHDGECAAAQHRAIGQHHGATEWYELR